MKFFSTLLLALGLALTANPAAGAFINGYSYTDLGAWAAANGLRLTRNPRNDEFVVTNRNLRLVFDKDSRTVEINGVNVALCFPVAVNKGQVFIAQLDLAKTLAPLIFSPPTSAKKIYTICLDPGHGGMGSMGGMAH